VLDVLLGQRACRRYAPDDVPEADVAAILEAATHAPSAENRQPWVFVVVRDPEVRRGLDDLTRAAWDAGGRSHAERTLASDPRLLADVDAFLRSGYGGAPVVVVAAGDGRDGTPRAVLASSVFPAVQSLLLASASLGYGSAMTTIAAHAAAELAAVVALPEGVVPFAVIPIGRPAAPLGPPRRRPVADVAHLDRYGTPFIPTAAGGPPPAPPPAG
jgi:nitroreductase